MLTRHTKEAEISTAIREEIRQLLEDNGLPERELGPNDRLNIDLGLTSLDLAGLVAALEMRLKADPFQVMFAVTTVRTVADLEWAYLKFYSAPGETATDDDLLEVRRLAEARREALEGTS
jgi:acyl carrier protein